MNWRSLFCYAVENVPLQARQKTFHCGPVWNFLRDGLVADSRQHKKQAKNMAIAAIVGWRHFPVLEKWFNASAAALISRTSVATFERKSGPHCTAVLALIVGQLGNIA